MSLIEHLFARAENQPKAISFTFMRDGNITHLDQDSMMRKAINLANVLTNKGGRDKNVLLAVEELEDTIISVIACMIANCHIVLSTYHRNMPHEHIKQIVKDNNIRLIISRQKSGDIPNTSWIHIVKAENCALQETLPSAEDNRTTIRIYDHVSGELNTFSLGQCIQSCRAIHDYFNREPFTASSICWFPLHTHIGFFYGILLPLCIDAKMTLFKREELDVNPSLWLELITKFKIGFCVADNHSCLRSASYVTSNQVSELELSSLKVLMLFDKPIKSHVLSHFLSVFNQANLDNSAIFPGYDNIESAFMLTAKRPNKPISKLYVDKYTILSGTIKPIAMNSPNASQLFGRGFPLNGNDIIIRQTQTQQQLPHMHIGEVCFKGNSVALSNSPKDSDGYIHSGDLGFLDDRGELYLFGRIDDYLEIGSFKFNKSQFFADLIAENSSLAMHHFCYFSVLRGSQLNLIVAFESELKASELNSVFDNIIAVMQNYFNIANVKIAVFAPHSIPRNEQLDLDEDALKTAWLDNSLVPRAFWEIDKNKSDVLGERKAIIHLNGLSSKQVTETFQEWLHAWLSMRCHQEHIDFDKHLSGLGLDFQAVIELSREIDITFGQWFNPAYLWEFPNTRSLANLLFSDSHHDDDELPALNTLSTTTSGVLSQQESLLLNEIEQNSQNSAYQALRFIEVHGHFDIDVFEDSINEVAKRHAALRACYEKNYDEYERYISAEMSFRLQYIDLSHLEDKDQDNAFTERMLEFEHAIIDISRAPLWQVRLVRFAPDHFGVAIKCHHLIADSWGLSLIMHDTIQLYECLLENKQIPPISSMYQYDDYACWQKYCYDAGLLTHQIDYWKQRLSGVEQLSLPYDYPVVTPVDTQAHCIHFEINEALTKKMGQLAIETNASLYTAYISAFQLLLAWFCNSTKVAFKSKHFNRQRQHSYDIIGNFESGYVIHESLFLKTTVEDLVSINQDILSRHYRHIDAAFQELLNALPNELHGIMPNCELTFNRYPHLPDFVKARVDELYDVFSQNQMKDDSIHLSLHHFHTDRQTHCLLQCRQALFDTTTMNVLVEKYVHLLEQFVSDKEQPIANVIGDPYLTHLAS